MGLHSMGNYYHRQGTVLLMVVFAVALLAALVMGMLQMNMDEIQIVRNQIGTAEALGVAEAGLNDAMAELRADSSWDEGFSDKSFPGGGDYTVVVDAPEITAVGTSTDGYVAVLEAEVLVSVSGPPHTVTIQSLKVNE